MGVWSGYRKYNCCIACGKTVTGITYSLLLTHFYTQRRKVGEYSIKKTDMICGLENNARAQSILLD